jgi:hypothetical protein
MLLTAQDNNPSFETDWDDYHYELFAPGDQTFLISLGIITPMNNTGAFNDKIDPPIGGTGSLILNYFLTPRLFIGGEIGGLFLPTIGGGTLFIVPLGIRVGTQFVLDGRFEFPIAAAIGMSWRNYLNLGYFGLYTKASASAFYRTTTYWGFGATVNWYWFPEFRAQQESIHAHFFDFNLSARYHF